MILYRLARPPLPSSNLQLLGRLIDPLENLVHLTFLPSSGLVFRKLLNILDWTYWKHEENYVKKSLLLILCIATSHLSVLIWTSRIRLDQPHSKLQSWWNPPTAHHEKTGVGESPGALTHPRFDNTLPEWFLVMVYHVGQWDEAKRWMILLTIGNLEVNKHLLCAQTRVQTYDAI